jgi:hypothetical protein
MNPDRSLVSSDKVPKLDSKTSAERGENTGKNLLKKWTIKIIFRRGVA